MLIGRRTEKECGDDDEGEYGCRREDTVAVCVCEGIGMKSGGGGDTTINNREGI